MRSSLSYAFNGSGGLGVMSIGEILLETAAKKGFYGVMSRSFGSQISGGEAVALIRLEQTPVETLLPFNDFVFSLDWKNVAAFFPNLRIGPATKIFFDHDQLTLPEVFAAHSAQSCHIPLSRLQTQLKARRINIICLGYAAATAGLSLEDIRLYLKKRYIRQPALADSMLEEFSVGYEQAQADGMASPAVSLTPAPRWKIKGNDLAAYGVLRAGVRFAAAYPITPASDFSETLAPLLASQKGGLLIQAEDEIAAIHMAIGASFGGVPSVVATSGPGFSLMSEAIGLAIMTETPLLVVNVARGGPSTGLPTKPEQADLNIALYGSHGDAPRVVTAPLSGADHLLTAQWSVGLAEKLQTAVIMLSDQYIAQSLFITDPVDLPSFPHLQRETWDPAKIAETYLRHRDTKSGISAFAVPGTPEGVHTATGLEHGEQGRPSTNNTDHQIQLDKRLRKLTSFDYGDLWGRVEGSSQAVFATIGFGTGAVVAQEALRALPPHLKDTPVRQIALRLLSPLPKQKLQKAFKGIKTLFVLEQNHSGQLLKYLRSEEAFGRDLEVIFVRIPPAIVPIPASIAEVLAAHLEKRIP